jgi:hypothetical protein
MSWLARAIGELGSQAGEAHEIGLDWRAREQAMRIAAARERLEQLMGPLRVQQLQEQIRQMGLPVYEGTTETPGGGLGAITLDPKTGMPSVKELRPGMSRESAKKQIQGFAASVAPTHRGFLDALANSLDDPSTDPRAAIQEAEKYAARISEVGVGKGTAKILGSQIPYGVSDPATGVDYAADEKGVLHAGDGSAAPPELQNLYNSAYKGYQQRSKDQYDMLAKREGYAAARQARAFAEQREKLAIKAGSDAVIAQNRLLDSEKAATLNSNAGDIIVLENFMQLMFGQQPRGIRGSPQWFEEMRKMVGGSLGQRAEGWVASVAGKGLLGDEARSELLRLTKILVQNRVQAGASQADMYKPGVGIPALPGIDFQPAPDTGPGRANDLTDLGGKPALSKP